MTSMASVLQGIRRGLPTRLLCLPKFTGTRTKSSLWHPDYLEAAKTKFPEYSKTNIQIKGYDYPVLEMYQKKINWVIKILGINVTDSWPQEYQKLKVVRYKPKSEITESEFIMKRYERNIQVSDVCSHQMGTLIDLVISMCPPGVTVQFHPHTDAHYEDRFVPEIKLLELKEMLEEIKNEK